MDHDVDLSWQLFVNELLGCFCDFFYLFCVMSAVNVRMLDKVFCFKQKTAYEMRISDWSSDVCSSDLLKFRREDTSSFSATVGGDFDIGASLLNIEAGYTRATKRDPHRTEWSFETDGFGGSYDTTGIFPRYSVDDVAYDAANFDFNEVDYENRHAVEILYQGRIDYRTPIAIGDDSTIKFGVKAPQRNKTNNEEVTVYDGFAGALALP